MKRRKVGSICNGRPGDPGTDCKVESIVTIDDRGQMVLPKGLRDRAGIAAGDKLAVASWQKDGEICCITLMKVENLVEMVRGRLGPVLKEIL